jgi:hypothetical protein
MSINGELRLELRERISHSALMEDQEGNAKPTDAVELMGELRPTPRLVFLLACLSAAAADSVHATGLPGSKLDRERGRAGSPSRFPR